MLSWLSTLLACKLYDTGERGEGRRCILIAVYWPVVLKVSVKEASAAPWKTTLATAWFTSGTGLAMTVAARAERMVTMVNCILLVEVGWLVLFEVKCLVGLIVGLIVALI